MGAYALGTLAAALLVLGGFDYYRDIQHQQDLARLATDLIAAGDRVSANAAEEIQGAASKARNAVYLVARKEGANETGQATAWAFEPDRLATNAHVTEAIKGHEKEFLLIAPNGERIAIDRVESHPGYLAFKAYKATQGRMSGDSFKPLDVINEYDVGIIYPAGALPVDPGTGAPATLSLATEDEIAALEPAEAVAMVGFPIEGLAASMVATEAPSTVQFGYISRLTDVFMCRADPAHQLLIQHSVPVTGGVSGSPLIDKNGKVIGIVNGGNTASVLKTCRRQGQKRRRRQGQDRGGSPARDVPHSQRGADQFRPAHRSARRSQHRRRGSGIGRRRGLLGPGGQEVRQLFCQRHQGLRRAGG